MSWLGKKRSDWFFAARADWDERRSPDSAGGIEPLAFADNNPSLAGMSIEGVPVFSAMDAVKKFGKDSAFIVTVWGAHSRDRLAHRKQQWRDLGCDAVISFMPLFWKYPEIFLPHYSCDLPHKVFDQSQHIEALAGLWSDDFSRAEFSRNCAGARNSTSTHCPSRLAVPPISRRTFLHSGPTSVLSIAGPTTATRWLISFACPAASLKNSGLWNPTRRTSRNSRKSSRYLILTNRSASRCYPCRKRPRPKTALLRRCHGSSAVTE